MSFQVMLQQLTTGFGQTLLIFFLTLLFSLPLGMVVYFGRVSRFKPLSWIVKAYISIMRGTPLMLQLLLWYFGPFYLWGMNIGNYKFTAIILGCSLNYAAYFAEFLFSNTVQRKIKVTINNAQFNIVEKRSSYNSHYRLIFIRKEYFHEETPSPNFYSNSRHFNIDSRSASTG